MKYAVEMGSGVMMYIQSLVKTGSGIQKLMGGAFGQLPAYSSIEDDLWWWCIGIFKPQIIMMNCGEDFLLHKESLLLEYNAV
jgi:hypothetical protein